MAKTQSTSDFLKQHDEHRLIAWKREREIRAEIRKSIDNILDDAPTDSLIKASRMVAEVVQYDLGYRNGRNDARLVRRKCQS